MARATRSPFGGILHEERALLQHIREGRFQRAMALVTALSAILSGGEVAYEHYRGSYSQQVMYTPVILSFGLALTAACATISRRVARVLLPLVSILVVLDGVTGFVFHVRGIARKPGGWRVPINNLIMGPPVFAPLLFGLAGYLGLITSFLRTEDEPNRPQDLVPDSSLGPPTGIARVLPKSIGRKEVVMAHHVREGQFQRNIACVAGLSAIFSGVEASYSHYQNNFQFARLQTSPLVIAPLLGIAGVSSVWSRQIARTLLPALSLVAMVNGGIGTFYHARGILRKPGGLRLPLYNVMYGPPIFAPMLFAASGFMGLLASMLRRPR